MGTANQRSRRTRGSLMIEQRELEQLRGEWSLESGVIEKDYVLGWLLAGIAQQEALSQTWIFKGGTCLRKCYYETYRFSEDLDFTVTGGGPETPDELRPIFVHAADWLQERSGIELVFGDKAFERRTNRRGKDTTGGKIAFRGPNPPNSLPNIKIDITSDEALLDPPPLRPVEHPYGDQPLPIRGVRCY